MLIKKKLATPTTLTKDKSEGESEGMTTEQFLALCYKCKLSSDDLEVMTIGNCLDYIDEWIDLHDTEKQETVNVRNATQADFDSF